MAKRKDKPVPLSELKFSGDSAVVLARLKMELEERDRHINKLENQRSDVERCVRQVSLALDEAMGMADRFGQFVEDAKAGPDKYKARLSEMARYSKLFREAGADFRRMRA